MGGEISGGGHERSFCGAGEVLFLDLGSEGYVRFGKMHCTRDLHTFPYVCSMSIKIGWKISFVIHSCSSSICFAK